MTTTPTGRPVRTSKRVAPLSDAPDLDILCCCPGSAMACETRKRLVDHIRLLQKRLDEAMAREAKRQAKEMR